MVGFIKSLIHNYESYIFLSKAKYMLMRRKVSYDVHKYLQSTIVFRMTYLYHYTSCSDVVRLIGPLVEHWCLDEVHSKPTLVAGQIRPQVAHTTIDAAHRDCHPYKIVVFTYRVKRNYKCNLNTKPFASASFGLIQITYCLSPIDHLQDQSITKVSNLIQRFFTPQR